MTTKRVTKEEKQQRHEWAMRKIDQGSASLNLRLNVYEQDPCR